MAGSGVIRIALANVQKSGGKSANKQLAEEIKKQGTRCESKKPYASKKG